MRTEALVLAACVSLAVACTAPVRVAHDGERDFAGYHTWSWLPPPRAIQAQGDHEGLAAEVRRIVTRELAGRGLERARRGADLRIGVVLRLRREHVESVQTGAVAQLSSLHSSGSYEVQSPVRRRETYERCRLVIYAVDPREGRIVWTGALEDHFRGRFSPHLDEAISKVVERFPRSGDGPRAPDAPAPFEPAVPREITGPTFNPEPDVSS